MDTGNEINDIFCACICIGPKTLHCIKVNISQYKRFV